MSWRIGTLLNEANLSIEHIEELNDLGDKNGFYLEDTGGFPMDYDAMEHADYLNHEWFIKWLSENKDVSGQVIWTATEGDDAGETWGYLIKDGTVTFLSKKDCYLILADLEEQNA